MKHKTIEWFKQAEYDIDTAEYMFKGGRFFYCVFMCHLSVEKSLKGIFTKLTKTQAPKTHDLAYLLKLTKFEIADDIKEFINDLNDLSVPTRYPEELDALIKQYDKNETTKILKKAKGAIKWLKEQ